MRDVSSDQVFSASRKEVAAAYGQCVAAARTVRALASEFLEPPSDALDRENAGKLVAAAEVLESVVQSQPVGRRDRGNTLIRHISGELVKTCRVIFRSPMYGVVATITAVLLDDSEIPVSTIRSWHPRK